LNVKVDKVSRHLKYRNPEFEKLTVGKLIRYAFANEDQVRQWYTGIIRSGWRNKSWKNVLFEDGENMWVRLDAESKGNIWDEIDCDVCDAERSRFSKLVGIINPEALEMLGNDREGFTGASDHSNERDHHQKADVSRRPSR